MNTETLHLILSAGLVAAAAALDVAANLMLARSDGFKKRLIGIAALALVGLAFYCLSLAVQYMDLAVAYSMWGSLGILGTSLCGWLFLRQRLKPCAFCRHGSAHYRHDPAAHELDGLPRSCKLLRPDGYSQAGSDIKSKKASLRMPFLWKDSSYSDSSKKSESMRLSS